MVVTAYKPVWAWYFWVHIQPFGVAQVPASIHTAYWRKRLVHDNVITLCVSVNFRFRWCLMTELSDSGMTALNFQDEGCSLVVKWACLGVAPSFHFLVLLMKQSLCCQVRYHFVCRLYFYIRVLRVLMECRWVLLLDSECKKALCLWHND